MLSSGVGNFTSHINLPLGERKVRPVISYMLILFVAARDAGNSTNSSINLCCSLRFVRNPRSDMLGGGGGGGGVSCHVSLLHT